MDTPSTLRDADTRPSGWREELAHALAQPELADVTSDTEPVRRAAYWLAVVLGNCRLRGLDLGDRDGSLPAPVALAAGRWLVDLLGHWSQDARRLEERLQEATDTEANDACFDLLEARMEAWAAFVAIDEAYQTSLAGWQARQAEFGELIDMLLDGIEELDRRMQGQTDLLSLVAPYPLLDNWKRSLGPTYAEVLPWWLDGTLEAAARVLDPASWGTNPVVVFVNEALAARWTAETPQGIAAASPARTALSPERAALAAAAFGVEGDDNANVRFDLDRDHQGQWQLRVHLGPASAAARHTAVVLGRHKGGGVGVPPSGGKDRLKPELQPLVAGVALVPLPEPVLPGSDLGLLSADGTFHRLHPKEDRG
jgi:hypothetical protein